MHFDMAGIDHQPLKVRFANQLFEQAFPNAFVTPTAESAMRVFPIAIVRRQIPPRCTGAQDPKHSIDIPDGYNVGLIF